MRHGWKVVVAGAAAAVVGCGGGDNLLLPGSAEPAAVTIAQGNEQSARVGEQLPEPIVATVTDANDRPVVGASVAFVLNDPPPGAAVDPATATTDADGAVSTRVTAGTQPGQLTGEIRALGADGNPAATAPFQVTVLSEDANGIRSVSGDGQSAPVGSSLPDPLVVEVADAFGNPIEGVEVAWTADGGGTVSAAATTTGTDGRTQVSRTLGPAAGTQRTLATVAGLAGSPVTFVHTATAGSAAGVSIVSGDDQEGPAGAALPKPVVVLVQDAEHNPVTGVAVAWVIGSGGGTVSPTTSNTGTDGQAGTTWTLGTAVGPNTLSAVVSGIGIVEFSATALAGPPAKLSMRTQPSSTATSGVPLAQQPVIQLLDAQGRESKQSGVTVTAAIASGGGTLGGTISRATDANGRASYTDLVLTGAPGSRTLRFSAPNLTSVTSSAISLGAATTVTTITDDSPDPSPAGAAVTVRFQVTSAAGTPTGTVTVSDGATNCSGSLAGGVGSCQIILATAGSRTLQADYAGSGAFGASSDTEGHTVEAPLPDAGMSSLTAAPETITAGVSTSTVTATVRDAAGAPLAGRSVTLASSGSDNSITPNPAVTGGDGVATFSFGSAAPEAKTLTATVDGLVIGPASIVVEQVVTTTSITGDAPDPSAPGTPVEISFLVTSALGPPPGRVDVRSDHGDESCSAGVAEGRCMLVLRGQGTRTLTASYQGTEQFAPSAGTATHEIVGGSN